MQGAGGPSCAPSLRVGLTIEGQGPWSCCEGWQVHRRIKAVAVFVRIDTRLMRTEPARGTLGPPGTPERSV